MQLFSAVATMSLKRKFNIFFCPWKHEKKASKVAHNWQKRKSHILFHKMAPCATSINDFVWNNSFKVHTSWESHKNMTEISNFFPNPRSLSVVRYRELHSFNEAANWIVTWHKVTRSKGISKSKRELGIEVAMRSFLSK